jgi:hypothetical protein
LNWMDIYLSKGVALDEPSVTEILDTNQNSTAFGLRLKPEDAVLLIKERNRAIRNTGRVETGLGVLTRIINVFCRSAYINSNDYVQTLGDLVQIFYLFKNETEDYVDDDELVIVMSEYYNHSCKGSLELLKYKELPQYAARVKEGFSRRKAER